MRLKSELYKKEQDEIIIQICNILCLENNTTYTLHELDNNTEIQKQLIDLIPEIRKWFSFNNMKAVGEPEKRKRPWLSIIKQLTKNKFHLESKDYRIFDNNKEIRTRKYTFITRFPIYTSEVLNSHPLGC